MYLLVAFHLIVIHVDTVLKLIFHHSEIEKNYARVFPISLKMKSIFENFASFSLQLKIKIIFLG